MTSVFDIRNPGFIGALNGGLPTVIAHALLSGDSTIAAYVGQNGVDYYYFSAGEITAGYSVNNIAVPGNTIAQQTTVYDAIPDHSIYNTIVVELPLNNLDPAVATATTIAELQTYITRINATKATGARIVICTMTPCKQRLIDLYGADGPTAYQKWLDINTAIMGGGATPITGVTARVNGHTAALNDGSGNLASQYEISGTTDHIHENNAARQIIAFFHRRGMYAAGAYADTVAPTATWAVTDSTHITATFSKEVTATNVGYSFTLNGSPLSISSISGANGTNIIVFTVGSAISFGDTVAVSYNPATGDTLSHTNVELATITAASVTNSLSGALSFVANAGTFANTSGVYTTTGGNPSSVFAHATTQLGSGVDGRVYCQYQTDAINAILCLNTAAHSGATSLSGCDAGFSFYGGTMYTWEGATPTSNPNTPVAGRYYGIKRTGSVFTLEQSTDTITWTPLGTPFTFTDNFTGAAVAVINILNDGDPAPGKMYNPSGY